MKRSINFPATVTTKFKASSPEKTSTHNVPLGIGLESSTVAAAAMLSMTLKLKQ
jgi:hypothetical protein